MKKNNTIYAREAVDLIKYLVDVVFKNVGDQITE